MLTFATYLTTAGRLLAGVVGLAALLLLCFEVVARYFAPSVLPDWGSEIVIYLTVWALFLVAGELALDGGHVHADFVVDRLDTIWKFRLGLLGAFAGLIFSLIFLWYGYQVVAFAWMIGEEGESTLRFPKWIYYLSLPVGMALQCVGYVARILTLPVEPDGDETLHPDLSD